MTVTGSRIATKRRSLNDDVGTSVVVFALSDRISTRVSDSCREEEKSPGARAPKFVGALKVVPKLVASDRKIGRSKLLAPSHRWLGAGSSVPRVISGQSGSKE